MNFGEWGRAAYAISNQNDSTKTVHVARSEGGESRPYFDNQEGTGANVQAKSDQKASTHQETADDYIGVVAQLCPRHRVIVCKDSIQWIFQRRKNGGAERPWRGIGHFRTRDALIRVSASVCGRVDPTAMAILAALLDRNGGAA